METLFVRFKDETQAEIVAWFAVQQSPVGENDGEVDPTDSRWRAYFETMPPSLRPVLPAPV
ncbi:hypothetical protein [Cupriavidus basilensis]